MRGAPPLCAPLLRGGLHPPLHSTLDAGAPPRTPGDFPVAGKSPKARQGLRPLESPGANFPPSLVLRFACTRATLSHKNRPICHFKLEGKSVLFFPSVPSGKHSLLSIRGTAGVLFLTYCPELHPFLGGAALVAAGGMIMPPKGSTQRGDPSGRFFGDFPRDGKVTRVPSMAKPCSRGAPAGGCRDYQSRNKVTRGMGRSAHTRGLRGNAALSPQGKFVNKKNAPPPVRRKPSP